MAADASIYGMINQQRPQPGPLDQFAQAMTIKGMIDQQQLGGLQREKLVQDMADERAFNDAVRQGGDLKTRIGELIRINPKAGLALQEKMLKQENEQLTGQKTRIEMLGSATKQLRDLTAQVNDDAGMAALKERAAVLFGPDIASKMNIPDRFDPAWKQSQLMTADDLLKRISPELARVDTGGSVQGVNPYTMAPVGPAVAKTVSPDAALSADVTQRGQDRPQYDASRGGFVTPPAAPRAAAPLPAGANPGFAGLPRAEPNRGGDRVKILDGEIQQAEAMVANAKNPQDRAQYQYELEALKKERASAGPVAARPNAPAPASFTPVTGADGKSLGPAQSESEKKELQGLNQQLETVKGAIAAVGKTPSAFGLIRGAATMAGPMAESLMGRADSSDERTARSYVFNVVSKVINERAGAAQSAQELARLRSFLPAEMDNAEQIMDKLNGFSTYLNDMKRGTTAPKTPVAADGAPVPTSTRPAKPQLGERRDGYIFKGGDPASPSSWEKA